MTLTLGEYLVQLLEAYEVDTVFGIPGVHTVELYRGLANSPIRHITPRHEQGAGFMADGYARVSGKPGVCFIITGPGMTNIMTPMAQAYGDSIPMLVISTVNSHGRKGSGEGWLHELPNQQNTMDSVTAFSRTINTAEELIPAVAQAYAQFEGARPRPVHLEIPINLLTQSADHLPKPARSPRMSKPAPSKDVTDDVSNMLANAASPVILAGGGAVSAADDIQALAEKIDAPVVMTINGRGILPPDHALAVSLSPSMPATRKLVDEADIVLALGTEMGSTDYDFYEDGGFEISGTLIRVDIDPLQIRRGYNADLALVADAKETAQCLNQAIDNKHEKSGSQRANAARDGTKSLSIREQGYIRLLEMMRDCLPNALLVGDQTQIIYAGNTGFVAQTPASYFNCGTGYGTLGYGLPAAIGASLAAPERPVVAIVGDGGFQFTIGELASAIDAKTPITLLLHNNSGYGEIKSYMQGRDIQPIGVDIGTPDFIEIAKAYGWRADHAASMNELKILIGETGRGQTPNLIMIEDDFFTQFED